MRQLVILIISILLLVFSGLWEINYLKNTSMYALSDVQYSKNAIENNNFKVARQQFDELEKDWKNMNKIWNIFVEHNEIDDIENAMTEYKVYIESENREEALVRAEILIRGFEHIVSKQQVSAGNVF